MTAAPTETAPALGVAPPLTPARAAGGPRPPAGAQGAPRHGLWPVTLGLAGGLCFVTFYATGGLGASSMATTEIVLTLLCGAVLAGLALGARRRGPLYGIWPALALLSFALLSGLSIVWSVQPDASWRDAGRLLAYTAVFAAAGALARVAPRRWPAILGAVALACVAICAYALVTKCFPGHFPEANEHARLYEPYGYWNALGLTAAMGALCCLWLGARRSGHALVSALAYPAMGLLLLTLLLAYSRGALLALAVGVALWLCVVPLRLRGAAVLLAAGAAAGAIAAWDFSQRSLSSEGVAPAQAGGAGHELGALVLAMLVLLTVVGVAAIFLSARHPPATRLRRRAGAVLLAMPVLAVLALLGGLAHSSRGLTGSISHAFHTLTNTHASVSNTPARLTAVASVRAEYWKEALKVFSAHPLLGAGADGYEVARLRYRTSTVSVKQAHGFIVQTMSDLGVVGLLLALALLLAWAAAAGRSTHPFNRRWRGWRELRGGAGPGWAPLGAGEERGYSAERIGLLSMLCVVVAFGVHSTVDWTWYVPGDAVVALVCAGWLAGRGPLDAPAWPTPSLARVRDALRSRRRPGWARLGVAGALLAGALLAAWSQWQPQRSEDARLQALAQLESHSPAALSTARSAVSRDPLSAEALFTLADVQSAEGMTALARQTLVKAVRLQPSNPQTWLALGRMDLDSRPQAALSELRAAIYLDPQSISLAPPASEEAIRLYNEYVQALRQTTTATASGTGAGVSSASGSRSPTARAPRRAARRLRVLELLENRSRPATR